MALLGLPPPPMGTPVPPPMMGTGGGYPAAPQTGPGAPPPPPMLMNAPTMTSVGGILPIMSARGIMEAQQKASDLAQNQPLITGLAAHVRSCWSMARMAREQTVEERMFQSMRQRRGDYDPIVKAKLAQQGGGSMIYMMLTSAKCRGAAAWLRDVMMGAGEDKPWTLKPTPSPDMPPGVMAELRQRAIDELTMYMQVTGQTVPSTELRKFLAGLREEFYNSLYDEAKRVVTNMERKMEDQLIEGGFPNGLDQFLDDLCTFPAAFIKGPVVRNKPKLNWVQSAQGQYAPDVKDELVLEWERVDPFMCYPSPTAASIDDGFFIERHKLHQRELEEFIGVDGYDEGAIRNVLDDYGRGGLQFDWLTVDSTKAYVEGRSTTGVVQNPEKTIDALQFWGSVSGQMLLDWGMDAAEVPDKVKNYPAEVWLIGHYVIKATLNYHPLGLKPYFKASYEDIPGAFWGNSVCDLTRDCQDMCNAAARAIANNMAISSGPQVGVNSERLPPGEDIEQMYPWKIWQFTCDPMGSTADALKFFQPSSNAQELMQIYEKFSTLADEYSSIPRYMTGDSPAGGAGRTASGMSMLMTNANKAMKQVVSNIDNNVMTPLLNRLYFYNMKYGEDPGLKGDVQVVARGANSIVAKESAQVRRNEFLTTISANPVFTQVVGTEGISALLREAAKNLNMDPDDVVPPQFKVSLAHQMQQRAMAQAGMPQSLPGAEGGPGTPPGPQGSPPAPMSNEQVLTNMAPITDNFAPTPSP